MLIDHIREPDLEFGSGLHVDTRFGLMNLGPLDVNLSEAPHTIKVGMCGTRETIEGAISWINKCRSEIAAKPSPRFNLFPRFPGFNVDSAFRSEIVSDPRSQRAIPPNILNPALIRRGNSQGLEEIVEIFLEELTKIVNSSAVDVLICAPPKELDRGDQSDVIRGNEGKEGYGLVKNIPTFHDLLKARSLSLRRPLQLLFPATYGVRVPRITRGDKSLQDEATRAWNFHVALYYKAGGRPWRLVRDPNSFSTCYVGISFYKSANQDRLLTSMAQVFNERGHGVIVRGAAPQLSKDDRHPHLTRDDASSLLSAALLQYKSEHRTMPARIVVHKSSAYSKAEIEGFAGTLNDVGIESGDLISLNRSWTRLFRASAYPPLRGTVLLTEGGPHFLYTKGSVEFYSAYPGLYVPRPIEYQIEWGDDTPKNAAKEILELTKMNWNTAQFDNSEPITLHAARQVGSILKYVEEDHTVSPQYAYYM